MSTLIRVLNSRITVLLLVVFCCLYEVVAHHQREQSSATQVNACVEEYGEMSFTTEQVHTLCGDAVAYAE